MKRHLAVPALVLALAACVPNTQHTQQMVEAPEMGEPLLFRKPGQPHAAGPALVAVAQDGLRKNGRHDAIEEGVAKRLMAGGGLETGHVAQRYQHGRRCVSAASQPFARPPSAGRQIALYRAG